MKRIICILLLFSLFVSLCSCKRDIPSALDSAYVINEALSIGNVYFSLAGESEREYMTPQLKEALFASSALPSEYAVILGTRIGGASEVGILYSDGIAGVPDCIETARQRLDLISSFSRRDGVVLRYGKTVVYVSCEDSVSAREVIDGVFS